MQFVSHADFLPQHKPPSLMRSAVTINLWRCRDLATKSPSMTHFRRDSTIA